MNKTTSKLSQLLAEKRAVTRAKQAQLDKLNEEYENLASDLDPPETWEEHQILEKKAALQGT